MAPDPTVPQTFDASDPAAIELAAAALLAGGVVLLPTDTVYGLAALPRVPGATAQLFALKGRGVNVPLAVLCADVEQALTLGDEPDEQVRAAATEHWPGPLTLVLRRRPDLGYELGEPADTVGVRCPAIPLVRAIAEQVGPIATTSANLHGHPTPPQAADAGAPFVAGLALLIDGGPCVTAPSTVVDTTTDPWKVLRQGGVTLDLA